MAGNRVIFSLVCCLCLWGTLAQAQTDEQKAKLSAEIEADLTENIIPFWVNNSVDPAGGFYGAESRRTECQDTLVLLISI